MLFSATQCSSGLRIDTVGVSGSSPLVPTNKFAVSGVIGSEELLFVSLIVSQPLRERALQSVALGFEADMRVAIKHTL